MKILKCLCGLLIIISMLAPSSLANDNNSGMSEEINEMIKVRKEFGLNQDASNLNRLINKKELKPSKYLSVPLTEEEEQEISNRIEMQEKHLPAFNKHINTVLNSNEFGGLFIDQTAGGIVKVGLTEKANDKSAKKEKLKSLFPDKDRIEFFEAKVSLNQLDDTHEQVAKKITEFAEQGIVITGINTDIINNRVEIGVENLSSENESTLLDFLGSAASYTLLIEEKASTATNRNIWYGDMQAGLRIVNSTRGSACTSNIGITDGTGLYYVLTAGHCATLYQKFTQGGTTIGQVERHTGYNGTNADAMAIRVPKSYANTFAYLGSSKAIRFTATQPTNADWVGEIVYMSGISSGVKSGRITSLNYTAYYPNSGKGTYFKQRLASYPTVGGDSGGPVYTARTLRGIQSGVRGDGTAIYSHIGWALYELNMKPAY